MKYKFTFLQNDLLKLPNKIICYWATSNIVKHFKCDKRLGNIGKTRQGLSTSDNDRFLRYWYEVRYNRIYFDAQSCDDTYNIQYKWYPFNKAGIFKRWFSSNQFVVNYEQNGREIKDSVMKKYPYLKTPGFVVKNTDFYFVSGITWNDVSTDLFCSRYISTGFIFADAAPMFFSDDNFSMLGYFNSCVFQAFASVICQGLHYSTGQISQIPFIEINSQNKNEVHKLVKICIDISKKDLDTYEESWEFKKHYLL